MVEIAVDRLIELSLEEDLASAGDITSEALIAVDARGKAELWAKEPMVLSGLTVFQRVFEKVDPRVSVRLEQVDGARLEGRALVATLDGPMRALLLGERTALNFVQRLSGIATATAAAVKLLEGSSLKILDTRKTTPGLRRLSKQAVRHGGGLNHRIGLFDGVLIKDNHLAAVGGRIGEALRLAKERAPRLVKIEIEITSLDQLEEAILGGAHVVMLDNMSDERIAEAVKLARGRVELEVSGGITEARLKKLATLGVDYVSMGALTHSSRAVDLSLEVLTVST